MEPANINEPSPTVSANPPYPKLEITPLLRRQQRGQADQHDRTSCSHQKISQSHTLPYMCACPSNGEVALHQANMKPSSSSRAAKVPVHERLTDTCLAPLLQDWKEDSSPSAQLHTLISDGAGMTVSHCEGVEHCDSGAAISPDLSLSNCSNDCLPPDMPETVPRFFREWIAKKFRAEGVRANKVLVTDSKYQQLLSIAPLQEPLSDSTGDSVPRNRVRSSVIGQPQKPHPLHVPGLRKGTRDQQYFRQGAIACYETSIHEIILNGAKLL